MTVRRDRRKRAMRTGFVAIAGVERRPHLAQHGHQRDRAARAAVDRTIQRNGKSGGRPLDAHLVCRRSDEQDRAAGRAQRCRSTRQARRLCASSSRTRAVERVAQSAAPLRISGRDLALEILAVPRRPEICPFSTMTLPRRSVITGQAKMSWPSQGV